MIRKLLFALLLTLASATGCAVCSPDQDCTYSYYGGAWERHDRLHGRVGSAFAPAGGKVEELPPGDEQDLGEMLVPPQPEPE